MSRRPLLTIITCMLASALVIIPLTVFGASDYTSVPGRDHQGDIVTRGAVIRVGTNTYIHDDAFHEVVGVDTVEIDSNCNLRVYTDHGPDEQIVAAVAEEDETMAKLNVQAGASVGLVYTTLIFYRNGVHICANSSVFGTNSNIWLDMTWIRGNA